MPLRSHTVRADVRPASATIVPSPFAVLRDAVVAAASGYRARVKRHEVERMLGFEDALLRDIGVTRDDVHQALTTGEPSRALARAARVRSATGRRR